MKHFIILFLIMSSSFLQATNLDSLQKVIDKMPDDTNKVNLINQNIQKFHSANHLLGKKFCYLSMHISEQLDFTTGMIKSYNAYANILQDKGNPDSALYYYNLSMNLAKKINNNVLIRAAYLNLGWAYMIMKDYDKAIYNIIDNINFYTKIGDSLGVYDSKIRLGTLYGELGRDKECESLLTQALFFYTKKNNLVKMAKTHNFLGVNKFNLNKHEESEIHLKKAIQIAEKINDSSAIYDGYSSLVLTLFAMNKQNEAISAGMKSISYSKKQKLYCSVFTTYLDIADGLIGYNLYDHAIPYLDSSLYYQNYCEYKDIENERYLYEDYYKVYKKLKVYDKAVYYLEKAKGLNDSLNNKKNSDKLLQLQTQFQTKEKESEIILLTKEKELKAAEDKQTRNILISVTLFILLIVFFIYFKIKSSQKTARIKATNDILELQQKLLLTQMNPHFIFNSLKSIQNFVLNNNTQKASDYIAEFGQLMRLILEASRKELIALEDEIKILEYYLKLEKARSGNQFEFKVEVTKEIANMLDELYIPSMFLQPIVENAVNHGIKQVEQGGKIDVIFTTTNEKQVQIDIIDNGKGVEGVNYKSDGLSISSKIIEERIKNFNQTHTTSITYKMENMKAYNSQGTKVTLTIPMLSEDAI